VLFSFIDVMSKWTKEELENMLEDVVNELDLSELDLSEFAIEFHGPLGTPPAELVKLVLAQEARIISMLEARITQTKNCKLGSNYAQCDSIEPSGDCKMCDNLIISK
jgi:hypothetical protein